MTDAWSYGILLPTIKVNIVADLNQIMERQVIGYDSN